MLTYEKAEQLFRTARDKRAGKPLCNNTRLYRTTEGGSYVYCVRLHWTDVVKIYPGDYYEIHSGGWHTKTTAARIREFTNLWVLWSKREICTPALWDDKNERVIPGNSYVYFDGMVFDKNFKLVPFEKVQAAKLSKEAKANLQHIKKDFTVDLVQARIEAASGDDTLLYSTVENMHHYRLETKPPIGTVAVLLNGRIQIFKGPLRKIHDLENDAYHRALKMRQQLMGD